MSKSNHIPASGVNQSQTFFKPVDDEPTKPWLEIASPDGFELREDGVYFQPASARNKERAAIRVSGPCWVKAFTRDQDGESCGRIIVWIHRDGYQMERAILEDRFHQGGIAIASDLALSGLEVVSNQERKLIEYLGNFQTKIRYQSASQVGWIEGDRLAFVTPSSTITDDSITAEPVIFQPHAWSPTAQTMHGKGSLKDWKTEVFVMTKNQPWLLFNVSFAFVGPLLRFAKMDPFGVHIYKGTSRGKTTGSQIAASVWGCGADPSTDGKKAFIRRYHATANALQGLALAHNDMLMALDEINSCDAKDFGKIIYDLFGGSDKARLNENANLKSQKAWRIALLSNGEYSASEQIRKSGNKIHGGMLVRLLDIPAPENLILGDNPKEFVRKIKSSCSKFYGTAGPAYLRELIKEYGSESSTIDSAIEGLMDTERHHFSNLLPKDAKPEFLRVIDRFVLVQVAGLLAIDLLGLPVSQQEIRDAVRIVCVAWLGGSNLLSDSDRGVMAIRDFILKHEVRFQKLPSDDRGTAIINRAGYVDDELFFFTEDAFKEACCELGSTAKELNKRELLSINEAGRLTFKKTVQGQRPRFYAVKKCILNETGDISSD